MTSRFVVGIDLGTTNCALAWADTSADPGTPIHMQEIPQLLNPGEPGHRGLLPSFLYIPGDIDFPAGSLALPWDPSPSQVIGDVARRRGAENPSRLVASAKSWLSHGGAKNSSSKDGWWGFRHEAKLYARKAARLTKRAAIHSSADDQ